MIFLPRRLGPRTGSAFQVRRFIGHLLRESRNCLSGAVATSRPCKSTERRARRMWPTQRHKRPPSAHQGSGKPN
jgi:hypothetical protein